MKFAMVALGLLLVSLPVAARDNGQWQDVDARIGVWFRNLKQPDNPSMPCCGKADAYWADSYRSSPDGQYIVTITDDRDDAPLRRPHIEPGTQFLVPNSKIKWDGGNPTGHGVLFIGGAPGPIYCFVPGGGV